LCQDRTFLERLGAPVKPRDEPDQKISQLGRHVTIFPLACPMVRNDRWRRAGLMFWPLDGILVVHDVERSWGGLLLVPVIIPLCLSASLAIAVALAGQVGHDFDTAPALGGSQDILKSLRLIPSAWR
jgi:hypothetical protein